MERGLSGQRFMDPTYLVINAFLCPPTFEWHRANFKEARLIEEATYYERKEGLDRVAWGVGAARVIFPTQTSSSFTERAKNYIEKKRSLSPAGGVI